MKDFWKGFCLRGIIAMGFGPIVLAVIYGCLGLSGVATVLSTFDVTKAILSISLMVFIAGGITHIYQTERLPLLFSILIHAGVLYLDYLILYLVNDWIPKNPKAIGIFSGCFILGFALIWLVIFAANHFRTKKLNTQFAKK